MTNNQLEDKLKENAEVIFGQGKELSAGHRERFEQRLKAISGQKGVSWKIRLTTAVASAAVLAGVVFLLNQYVKKAEESELSIVRSYYHLLLEEKADATRQLILQVDESHRDILFSNVDYIEDEPMPDVQLPDDEFIKLITGFYSKKIETLQNLQNSIISTVLVKN